jgi:urea transport system substrate-binding protein
MGKNHYLSKPVLIGEIQEDGQFAVVSQTKEVAGDEWSDFLPGSKDMIADWTAPIKCGNYNTKTKTCGGAAK